MTNRNAVLNNKGLQALTTSDELAEVAVVLDPPAKLQYLKGSKQMGLRLWNVLSPNLPGYGISGGLNGYPTFSIEGLKKFGLVA